MPLNVILKNQIQEDIDLNFTPDLPRLRYRKEPILVFLYDRLKDYRLYQKVLKHCANEEYRVEELTAKTVEDLYVFEREEDDNEWTDVYATRRDYGLPGKKGEKLPLQGKVLEVSRDVLEMLDYHYGVGYNYTRGNVQVKSAATKKVLTCLFYHNYPKHFMTDGGTFREGFKVGPASTTTVNGNSYYAV